MERCAGFSDGALCWALRRGALCWALRWSAVLGSQMGRCAGLSDGARCAGLSDGALCWALRWGAVLGSQTGRVVLGSQMERCAGLSDGAQPQVAKGERPRRGARKDVRLVPEFESIPDEEGHQRSSEAIRGHQRPSEAIKPPKFESILIDDSLDGLARPHMTQHGHSTA